MRKQKQHTHKPVRKFDSREYIFLTILCKFHRLLWMKITGDEKTGNYSNQIVKYQQQNFLIQSH